jgi:site-specific recombinase XerD
LTVEAYAYDLALIHRWLEVEELQLAQVGAAELHRFLAWERARASQPKSINRRLHTLRLYFRFAVGQLLPGGTEPAGRWRRSRRDRALGLNQVRLRDQRQVRVKEPRRVVEPLTVEQVRALLGSLRRYRDLCIAYTMLLCGLRSQEALGLRIAVCAFSAKGARSACSRCRRC